MSTDIPAAAIRRGTRAALPARYQAPIDTRPWPTAPGLVRQDDVIAVSATGVRYHGTGYEAEQQRVTGWLAQLAELRRQAQLRLVEYEPGPSATNIGGVQAEMELLESIR